MNYESAINPKIIMVVAKQLNECQKKPVNSIKIIINDTDILDIQADIYGPESTPYHKGIFRCKLVLPTDFPRSPPKGIFLTKIYHPNVSERGEICVNTLKKDWNSQAWNIYYIFEVIKCLLIIPFPESSLNEEAGKYFMEDYSQYFKQAKMITELYAIPNEVKQEISQNEINYTNKEKQNSIQNNFRFIKENMNDNNQLSVLQFNDSSKKDKNFLIEQTYNSPKKNDNSLLENSQNKMEEEQININNIKSQSIQKIDKKIDSKLPISLTFSQKYQPQLQSQNQQNTSFNTNTIFNSGKKETDKKKWLKRI